MRGLVLALALVPGLAACGPKGDPNAPARTDALLKVTSNVRDAEVYLDGRFIARVGSLRGGVLMKPGTHRLELRHDEYYAAYAEVVMAAAERKTIALELAPVLP